MGGDLVTPLVSAPPLSRLPTFLWEGKKFGTETDKVGTSKECLKICRVFLPRVGRRGSEGGGEVREEGVCRGERREEGRGDGGGGVCNIVVRYFYLSFNDGNYLHLFGPTVPMVFQLKVRAVQN